MFKRDKYHNCFQIEQKYSSHKASKKESKSSKERLEEVIAMLTFFGWDSQNIESLKQDWFLLEE